MKRQVARHEGKAVGQTDVRPLQDNQAAWRRQGDMHESQTQAASGIADFAIVARRAMSAERVEIGREVSWQE